MLAQFALFVFAMFAVLALVVDIGSVTLSRVLMQNAADSAAIEGLRERDLGIVPGITSDPFQVDCVRRSAARNVVSWTFDDDFALGADALQLGAGPNIQFTDEGSTDLNALQTIDVDAPRVYKPVLQRNQSANATHGDMVSGTFDPGAPVFVEGSDYSRADFNPGPAVPPGSSGLSGCPADDDFTGVPPSESPAIADDSFLVRLRRTSDRDTLANDPDVSSAGPALPLLFARGTTISGPDPVTGYSPRRDGLTVRATAIARTRAAMRIGSPNPSLPERGAVAYAIARDCWTASDGDATVDADARTIEISGEPSCPSGAVRFVAGPWGVGDAVPPAASIPIEPCAHDGSCVIGFVAIFQSIGGIDRVIGFGRSALVDPDDPTVPIAVPDTGSVSATLVRRTQRVADQNASAHLPQGLPTDLTPLQVTAILTANSELRASGGLLAPVLVR